MKFASITYPSGKRWGDIREPSPLAPHCLLDRTPDAEERLRRALVRSARQRASAAYRKTLFTYMPPAKRVAPPSAPVVD